MIYKTLIGLKPDLSKPIDTPEILSKNWKDNTEEKGNSSEEIDSEDENSKKENTENESKFVNSARPRNESPNSKKVYNYHL